jgi:3-methylcrotonyl-CoA carboxylase alpha subunit
VALRDRPSIGVRNSPWISLGARRFGGERYERLITLQTVSPSLQTTVRTITTSSGTFDVTVSSPTGEIVFTSVPGSLADPSTLLSTLNGAKLRTTIVSQPSPMPPPNSSASTSIAERLHIFYHGRKTTLVLPAPAWLQEKGKAVSNAGKRGVKAPMPSLIVEVKVDIGDKVETGQAIVILESMKTETVLRADGAGTVKSIGCHKGEMVEEGKELVEIEFNKARP